MKEKALAVYCSSSDHVAPEFFAAARELGQAIAAGGYTLVYGGTRVGLMGEIARSVHAAGGKVTGVIPVAIQERGIAYEQCDELIVTMDMRMRKATMEALADGFIAFPGGFGTLEELLEVLTLKQLRYHEKPIAIFNAHGFYDPLMHLFEHIYSANFARPDYRELYHVSATTEDLMDYLQTYTPPALKDKWS